MSAILRPYDASMSLTLCVLLWSTPGNDEALASYEDEVLALLGDHGARVVQRVRRVDDTDGPLEVQIIELPDEQALAEFMADPRRVASADVRDRVIGRTEIIRVAEI
ncbi:MAG: hypothetical protein JWQ70_2595 [Aeromicrobium sp.]|nr:hypothetical protein [Aeromicrobium sp.]